MPGFFSPQRQTYLTDARLRRAIQAIVSGGPNTDFVINPDGVGTVRVLSSGNDLQNVLVVQNLSQYRAGGESFLFYVKQDNGDIYIGSDKDSYGSIFQIVHNSSTQAMLFDGLVSAKLPIGNAADDFDNYGIFTEGPVMFKQISSSVTLPTPGSGLATLIVHDSSFGGSNQQCLKVLFDDGTERIISSAGGSGSSIVERVAVAGSETVSTRGAIYSVASGGLTVTLASALAAGLPETSIVIHDCNGNAGSSAITIATEGSETINGAASIQLTSNYEAVYLYNDGSNWFGWRMPGA